jgi:L-lysine exporter family protein LysE/ArgO
MTTFFAGFSLGLGLIVAIGAQNIWVLNQSMAGANRLVIALVCIGCDATLIVLGVFGASQFQRYLPALTPWLAAAGAGFLGWLAWQAARRAYAGNSGLVCQQTTVRAALPTALAALAISLLNPHVYLDTVVLLGSVGALQPAPGWFAAGAVCASVLWFGSLTGLAPRLRRLLSSPLHWRCFDVAIAVLLLLLAIQLASLPALNDLATAG